MLARTTLLSLLLALICTTPLRAAKDKEVEIQGDAFGQAMAEVGAAFKTGQWRQAEWKPAIAPWLDALAESVRLQTQRPFYKLPVTFTDVTPVPPGQNVAFGASKQLIVADTVNLARAEDCIILATKTARVSFAKRCVIVAKGAIEVAHGEDNTLLAGHFVHVSHDGSNVPRGRPGQAAPPLPSCSLVMSGAVADISHAGGSIVSARKRVAISHARQVCFLNADTKSVSHETDSEMVKAVGLPFPVRAESMSMPDTIQVVQVQPGRTGFAIVKQDDFEFIWRVDKPLVDRNGKEIESVAGWRIVYAYQNYLLLTNGTRFASYMMDDPRGG